LSSQIVRKIVDLNVGDRFLRRGHPYLVTRKTGKFITFVYQLNKPNTVEQKVSILSQEKVMILNEETKFAINSKLKKNETNRKSEITS
jgi:Tfp pilus assembly pilus retraction ATPase PilT